MVLVGRRPDLLAAVAAELGDQAEAIAADAASADDFAAVIEVVNGRFGKIGILVANADGHGLGTAADVTDQAWADSLRANMSTCLVSARACLPDLMAVRGAIVVVSSIAGLAAAPESVGYVSAKHGLIGLARSMARDFGCEFARCLAPRGALTCGVWKSLH